MGEILISGSGVTPGYLRDPERSDAAFVNVQPSGEHGTRWYRTGDLGRVGPNGALEFLGRSDGQVKVRGNRVEVGEIETVLLTHLEVQRCCVMLSADDDRDPRLVAYFVSPYSPGPRPSTLRTFLSELLPDYMVPTAFVELDALPLTASGKLDQRALPPPTEADIDGHNAYVAPSSETERIISEIFADLLAIGEIGVDDDFFSLGGHSLLATQAIARIRHAFDLDLEVHLLFTAPTVRLLASHVDGELTPADDELADLIREIGNLTDEEAAALLAAETGPDPTA